MPDSLEISDLEDFVDVYLQVIIAEANEAGFSSEEILAALADALERQRRAFEEDPDPAEDQAPRKPTRFRPSASTKH
jgi:hypothetical protein